MADSREIAVWDAHSRQQLEQVAYQPGTADHPDRLTEVLNDEPWDSVLDFGAGTSLWRKYFPKGKRYVALDQSPEMVAGGRSRFPSDPDAEFVLCPGIVDGARMPFAGGVFSIVFTSGVLQHCTDHDKAPVLKEIRRVLGVGGRLIMFENTIDPAFNPGTEDGRSHSQEGWRLLIEPFGFERIQVDGDRHVFRAV